MLPKSYSSLVRHPENAALFKAIEMSILATQHGQPLHLHAEGLRGTGKTTIIRSAKDILPRIERVKGCLYNCDPQAPHCPEHRSLDYAQLTRIGTEWMPMPFLEISHSSKVATVVGGIDLQKLTDRGHPEAALLPGTLAKAHRGIVFVDEINRLADTSPEIADVLLDVMGTKPGRLQIEDAGLPKVELTSLVTVWAASNPDEDPGPLEGIRRQLADRFDLSIDVRRPNRLSTLLAILEQANQPVNLRSTDSQLAVSSRLSAAMNRLIEIQLDEGTLHFLARMYLDHGLESLRALEAIMLGLRMHASLEGKAAVDLDDLRTVIPMALKHRTAPHVLSDIMESLQILQSAAVAAEHPSPEPEPAAKQPAASGEPARRWGEPDSEPSPQNLLSRLFGSRRERQPEEPQPVSEAGLVPNVEPWPPGSEREGGTSIADPSTLTIIAPPNAANTMEQVAESKLVMSEEALRRGD
jgi:magnesium chelatase subunit I